MNTARKDNQIAYLDGLCRKNKIPVVPDKRIRSLKKTIEWYRRSLGQRNIKYNKTI